MTEANTPRRKPQMPKQPRNRREKREQGKESSTEEEGSKTLAARPHEQPPDAPGTSVRHKGVCETKNPLRESLIDGRKKTQPIIKIKSTAKDLERQHRSLRRRIDFGMSRLRKRQFEMRSRGREYAFRAAWSATAQRKRNKSGPHTPQESAAFYT